MLKIFRWRIIIIICLSSLMSMFNDVITFWLNLGGRPACVSQLCLHACMYVLTVLSGSYGCPFLITGFQMLFISMLNLMWLKHNMFTDSLSNLQVLFCYLDFILQKLMNNFFPSVYEQPYLIVTSCLTTDLMFFHT